MQHERSTIGEDQQSGQKLLDACLSSEAKLHRYYMATQDKLKMPSVLDSHNLPGDAMNGAAVKDPFFNVLQFLYLTCAESHLIYWATLVLL